MSKMGGIVGLVGVRARSMYARDHPDKKLEIDWELLEIEIIKHMAIASVLREIPFDEGGMK